MTAVADLSFAVARGEIIGFLGPNGAGKSTTMRILTGYLPATSGTVRICGHSVATDPDAVKRLIGYMPENNPLPEDMRVSEYLYFRGRLKEIPRRKLGPRIDEVLELCDLKRVRHKIIGQLSKGYRQRVGIAEAILAEPPVIIMDEPTIGLDPHQILIVRDLIAGLRGDTGPGVILSETAVLDEPRDPQFRVGVHDHHQRKQWRHLGFHQQGDVLHDHRIVGGGGDQLRTAVRDQRVDDAVELEALVLVAERDRRQRGPVERSVGQQNAVAEMFREGGQARRAGLHHLPGDDVTVNDDTAALGESP
jgi:ABC-type Na+ transport system ATPase subunit NatA